MDSDMTATIREWTHSEYPHVLEESEGMLYMREGILEHPSNILYMLFPNGPSQRYPYPGEYAQYSHLREVDTPVESDSRESTGDVHEMEDVTNVDVNARKLGSSERSPRKGSASTRKVTSPRKSATPRKPTSSRKPVNPQKPTSPMKASSVPKVSSTLRNEITKET